MAETEKQAPDAANDSKARRRTLVGRVASDINRKTQKKKIRMDKTVVIEVVRSIKHPVYGKYVRVRTKYKAHDENNQYKAGDVVEIREHRPISRDKRWLVIRLIERPAET